MKLKSLKNKLEYEGIDLKYFELNEVHSKVSRLIAKVAVIDEFSAANHYVPIYYPNESYNKRGT